MAAAAHPAIPCIRALDPSTEFHIEEGCHVIEQTSASNDPGLSIARCRVTPGNTTHWHRLRDTTERYVVIEGTGIVEIGDLPATTLHAGDTVVIPPMCRQRIHNPGPHDLVFLALCTPRFVPACYEDLEDYASST